MIQLKLLDKNTDAHNSALVAICPPRCSLAEKMAINIIYLLKTAVQLMQHQFSCFLCDINYLKNAGPVVRCFSSTQFRLF